MMSLPATRVANPLDAYNPNEYNILTPVLVVDETSPLHQVRAQVVKINPDPGASEVFPMQGGKLYLAASSRRKLAAVAGIAENWRESGIIEDTPAKVRYLAVGAVQDAAGQWRSVTATKTLALEDLQKQPKMSPERLQSIWQYRYERAETGAWSRLATAALGLKPSYTAEELKKPFVVTRVILALDFSDPEVRRMVTARALEAQANIFGPATALRPAIGPGPVPSTVGAAISLDVAAGADSGLPEEFGSDLPFDDESPAESAMPLPATRGTDGQGEWIQCQTPGCAGKLRPGKGRTVTEVETYCLGKWGKVLCAKCQSAGQGRML